jgi:hypothetical protein
MRIRFSLRSFLIAFTLIAILIVVYPIVIRSIVIPSSSLPWQELTNAELNAITDSPKPILIALDIDYPGRERIRTRLDSPEFKMFAYDNSISLRTASISPGKRSVAVAKLVQLVRKQYDSVPVPAHCFILYCPIEKRLVVSKHNCTANEIIGGFASGKVSIPEDENLASGLFKAR